MEVLLTELWGVAVGLVKKAIAVEATLVFLLVGFVYAVGWFVRRFMGERSEDKDE